MLPTDSSCNPVAAAAFYKWRPREKLTIQPDVQWIAHRLVAGVRVAIEW